MGYACPVCDERQVDAEHLANHLAFTAILRNGHHEAWLDHHVPTWSELGPEELSPVVADLATEVEMDVPETEGDSAARPDVAGLERRMDENRLSERDRAVLAQARELTREMYDSPGEDEDQEDTGSPRDGAEDSGESTDSETQ